MGFIWVRGDTMHYVKEGGISERQRDLLEFWHVVDVPGTGSHIDRHIRSVSLYGAERKRVGGENRRSKELGRRGRS